MKMILSNSPTGMMQTSHPTASINWGSRKIKSKLLSRSKSFVFRNCLPHALLGQLVLYGSKNSLNRFYSER